MEYVIHGTLPTLNEHDKANRANRFVGAKLKKESTNFVAWQLKGKTKITEPCKLHFTWYISSRADFDNIAFSKKYILDGMVTAGILPDDSQKWVLGFRGDYFYKVPKGSEKVEVLIS